MTARLSEAAVMEILRRSGHATRFRVGPHVVDDLPPSPGHSTARPPDVTRAAASLPLKAS